ncbi:MAG: hypothetical protein QM733_22210 [Ilumatobacteraceae bacterium]
MQHRFRSYTATFAAAAALTVGFAACGSDSKSAGTTEATVEETDATDAPTTTADTAAKTTKAPTTIGRSTTTEAGATDSTDATSTADAGSDDTVDDSGAVPNGWVAYTSTPGDYDVAFPSTPTERTQAAPLPDGSTIDMVIVGSQSANTFFGTARGEYPAGSITDVDASLQGAQDTAIQNVNGTLIDSQDITLQGRPGRQFSASVTSNGQQGTLIQRVFLDGDTIYQNIVVGAGTLSPTDDRVASFFDSFEFTS